MSIAPSQVRFAALLALRKSIRIILTTLLLVPTSSVINRIFSGTWYVNWRLMVTVSAILTFLVFVFFFVTELLEFATEEARERQLRFIFPAVMWLRGIYLVSILMGFTVMAGEYREGDPWGIVVLPLVFVFLGFFAWPRAIELTESQIRQRRTLFGFKQIRFSDIESVVCDAGRNEIVIFGKNKDAIVHTTMHVDGERFLQRLKSLTGKNAYSVGDLEQNPSAQ
jgi:hypothetical protein